MLMCKLSEQKNSLIELWFVGMDIKRSKMPNFYVDFFEHAKSWNIWIFLIEKV